MAVVVNHVFVKIEVQSVFDSVRGKDTEPVTHVVCGSVLFCHHRVQIGIFRAFKMKTVQSVVQERIVRELQILQPRPLIHCEKQAIALIPLVVNSDDIAVNDRLCDQRDCISGNDIV